MSEKKPAGPNTTSTTGSRPDMKQGQAGAATKEGAADDPMGQPPGPTPAPNPESAPGGDKVGGADDEQK